MKSSLSGLAIILLVGIFAAGCSFRNVTFSEALRSDTAMYSGTLSHVGPFFVRVMNRQTENLSKKKLISSKTESKDVYSFSVCGGGDCMEADSYFYMKTKEFGRKKYARVVSDKIHGTLWFPKRDTMMFMINLGGRKRGTGFLTLPRNMGLDIQPISKRSNYGKKVYSVGLEFLRNGKVIGGFIHEKELIRIVVKDSEPAMMHLVVTALSLALANRRNEIVIF